MSVMPIMCYKISPSLGLRIDIYIGPNATDQPSTNNLSDYLLTSTASRSECLSMLSYSLSDVEICVGRIRR